MAETLLTAATRHRVVITPPRRWESVNVRELWRYRELLLSLIARDVKVRYKQTVLGVAWAILQPAMMMGVFTIFFARMAGINTDPIPYPLFSLSGLLPWFFFSGAVSSASMSVLGSERLITKVYFPRLAVPFAAIGAAAVDFFVACSLLAVACVGYALFAAVPFTFGVNLLVLPLVTAIVALLAAGIGTWLAALNVTYRDFRYIVPFLLQLGLFATPTIYLQPAGHEGQTIQWLLVLNPMASLVSGFRAGVVGGDVPWAGIAAAAGMAAVVFVVGCLYFRKVEDQFADII